MLLQTGDYKRKINLFRANSAYFGLCEVHTPLPF